MQPLPHGFYPNYPLELDWLQFILWLIFVCALAVGLYYTYKYLRERSKQKPEVITPEQKRSVWQETHNLFTRDVPADIKKYYFETSEALSAYLGFAELTTAEIREKQFAEAATLVQALTLADLVKFAKYIPMAEETDQYRRQALMVLAANKPAEEIHV